jgi:single-strand DNA-binding protein
MYQNRVHLIGYLGMSQEHKSVRASDRKYAVLSLATQRSWKGADEEWHSKTEWHRVVAWNGLGEYAATKLRKGDHIYIEGTLEGRRDHTGRHTAQTNVLGSARFGE